MPLQNGATFAGYTVRRLLGSGGMGEVYLVDHPRLPRHDALKVLRETATANPNFRTRFNREAELAATLWHPHIVGLHDRGEFEGRLWITMDYVEGTDAAQLLKDRYPRGLPLDQVVAVVGAVGSALDYAHQRGLLHRDVKPANLLLSESQGVDRRILLSDFGIARLIGEVSGLTATNHTMGTVAYSAPEQLMGAHIDGRSDQYSLAATAFRLLTGESPYREANQVAVISQHLHAPPPRVSDRRAELGPLDPVVMKAMAKNPRDRFPTCSEFAQALAQQAALVKAQEATTVQVQPLRSGWPPAPPHPGGPPKPWAPAGPPPPPGPAPLVSNQLAFNRPPRRSRRWLIVAAVVAVALVATGVIVALNVGGDDNAADGSATSTLRPATTLPRDSSSTAASATPTTFPMPALVGTPGNYQTIQTYIQQNGIEEQGQHRGDTKAPTIVTPMPDGWRDAGAESPNFAYQTLLYEGADAPNSRPYVMVVLSKLVGNVDPARVFALASGELYNLAGFVPDNPGKVATLQGYPEFELSGQWDSNGKPTVVIQKTVMLNWKQGFYVLQVNLNAAPEYRPIIDRMNAAIDADARIYQP
jgi:serine/threonine protein kinase, bacterial